MNIDDALETCLSGGGILFCGAGFSYDCLNFDDVRIEAGSILLNILNAELGYSFDDTQAAADDFVANHGHHALMNLLKNRYQVKNIPESIKEILRYPWERIYTTNYDDSISIALREIGKKYRRVTNLEDPVKIPDTGAVQVVHLHGSVETWDDRNFEEGCVLGAQSYYRHDSNSGKWKNRLQDDYNRCPAFFFIGVSSKDYYLNKVFFNASASRDKVFFINSTGSHRDRQIIAIQRNFGESLPIGRDKFSLMTKEARKKTPLTSPHLASFERVTPHRSEESIPGVDDVTQHLVYGTLRPGYLARDIAKDEGNYRVLRMHMNDIIDHVSVPGSISIVTGSVCTGKSLLVTEIMQRLASHRPVFRLRVAYGNIAAEVGQIVKSYPNCLLCMEECFALDDQLVKVADVVAETQSNLLLTSRDVAYDSASDNLIVSESGNPDRIRRFSMSRLTDTEIGGFVSLSERIAGWREMAGKSTDWKRRYIERTCHANMAEFLLRLLRSENVKKKVEEVYHECVSVKPELKRPLVVSLYLQHIGLTATLEVVSTLLEIDIGRHLITSEGNPRFDIIRRDGSYVRTLPSIGAREILRSIVDDRYIVDTVTDVVRSLAENRRDGYTYIHIFNQFMRYPIIQGVVQNKNEIDRFFDQLSVHNWIKRQSHFWLQFSMAKTDFGEYRKAEKYLDTAYGIANEHASLGGWQPTKQLDDQRAKFLLKSRTNSDNFSDHFQTFLQTSQIIRRILQLDELTFHIYDTISIYCEFITKRFPSDFHKDQHDLIRKTTRNIYTVAKRRSGELTEFYAASKAHAAIERMANVVSIMDA